MKLALSSMSFLEEGPPGVGPPGVGPPRVGV